MGMTPVHTLDHKFLNIQGKDPLNDGLRLYWHPYLNISLVPQFCTCGHGAEDSTEPA